MHESELQSENHRAHPLEWRSDSTCLLCLLEIIGSEASHRLKIHRRFALATLSQRLSPEPVVVSSSCLAKQKEGPNNTKSLSRLLQKNRSIANRVLTVLLDALTSPDLVDLAAEAVYRLYNYVVREESVLDSVLTHCTRKIASEWDQPEKWIPYLGVLQRVARVAVSSVALAIGQDGKLEELIVERVSEHGELVALHVLSVLEPLVKSDGASSQLMSASKRWRFMLQLAALLLKADSPQLQCAVLELDLILWTRVDVTDDDVTQRVVVATTNGIKRVILQSLPDMQVAALQVLDAILWKCWQSADGSRWSRLLLEQHDVADVLYDLLYGHHLPCLEYTLRCLQHLSRSPSFFQRRHIVLGVEPLIRVIPHLVTTHGAPGGGLSVAYAVHLLSEMLVRYDGGESLLERIALPDGLDRTAGGFDWAVEIAAMAVRSCVLHLETAGARLASALLERKNAPVPLPVDRIAELLLCCERHLASDHKKWRSETGRHHLQAVVRVLSSVTALAAETAREPRLLLAAYGRPATKRGPDAMDDGEEDAASDADDEDAAPTRRAEDELARIIDLVTGAVEKLVTAFREMDETDSENGGTALGAEDESLWCQWLELLGRLACGLPSRGSPFVERLLNEHELLAGCLRWRGARGPAVRESVDDLLTWFLDRRLAIGAPRQSRGTRFLAGSGPLLALRGLVRLIPADPADWGRWLSAGSSVGSSVGDNQRPVAAPFGAKCACIVLLYHVERRRRWGAKETGDTFVGQHSDAVLAGLGSVMLTRSPVDLDDPDVLRAVWFLAALYSREPSGRTELEVANAFVHLVEWFQPNRSLLPHWLHRIYTPDAILVEWTFAHKERARRLGTSLLVVWLTDEPDESRAETLVQLCLSATRRPGNDDDADDLLAAVFELVLHDRRDVSCGACVVLERVIRSDGAVAGRTLTRLIRSGVPRLVRLADSTHADARVVGLLRLLNRLDGVADEPGVVVTVASYLSRSIRGGGAQQLAGSVEQQPVGQQQDVIEAEVTLTRLDLWSLGCRFLTAALENPSSSNVAGPLLMENRSFIDFVAAVFARDDLPIWHEAAGLLAALCNIRTDKVTRTIRVSTEDLVRRLTGALVGGDEAESEPAEPRVLLNLLARLLSTDFGLSDPPTGGPLLIDPSARARHCTASAQLLRHLWCAAINWGARCDAAPSVHRCLAELARFLRRHAARFDPLTLGLPGLPWLLLPPNGAHPSDGCRNELLAGIDVLPLVSKPRDDITERCAGARRVS